jgi:3D (Asp-Asp-Asp) domain-containing protein
LKKRRTVTVFAFLVFSIAIVISSLNWGNVNKEKKGNEIYFAATGYRPPEKNQENVNKPQKEKEVYLFATGYYHPEEDQDFYVTGSYEEDLELNGRGITASGKEVKRGHVAVDPSVIPLGTEFHTEEYGILKAEDAGGRIKGNRIDIFAGNGERGLIKALKIRGWLKLKVLKWGEEAKT